MFKNFSDVFLDERCKITIGKGKQSYIISAISNGSNQVKKVEGAVTRP